MLRPVSGGRRLLVAGADALVVLRQVRSSDARGRDLYLTRTRSLDQVRAGIYQSAIVMRDYLLAADAGTATAQLEKWAGIRQSTDAALVECAAALDPVEASAFRNLETEVLVYWKLLEFISQIP